MDDAEIAAKAALDSELDFQRRLCQHLPHRNEPCLAAELLLVEEYTARARTAFASVRGDGDAAALEMVRIVAAICVRCMTNHGAPLRK